jgi:hypothetical protein
LIANAVEDNERRQSKRAPDHEDLPTRRRSHELRRFLSTEERGPVKPDVDAWDSVTAQPYCNVCDMVFKSQAFLEKHIKYSELHAKLLRKDQVPEQKLTAAEEAAKRDQHNIAINAKLLYSGNKLFWRIQESVLFDIYYRQEYNCIEIIPIIENPHTELARIFLDYAVVAALSKRETNAKISEREKNGERVTEEERATLQRSALPSFIIARMQIQKDDQSVNVPNIKCYYQSSAVDSKEHSQLLEHPPRRMSLVQPEQRRRSSHDEIQRAINELAQQSESLQVATLQATKKVEVLKVSALRASGSEGSANEWLVAIENVKSSEDIAQRKPSVARLPTVEELKTEDVIATPSRRPSLDKKLIGVDGSAEKRLSQGVISNRKPSFKL